MFTDDQIVQILNGSDLPAKYRVLEQLLDSKTSSQAIIEALEKASHDEEMGVAVRAIKTLQSDVHHRKALELGYFGPTDLVASDEGPPPVQQDFPGTPQVHQAQPGSAPAEIKATSESISRALLFAPAAGTFRRGAALLVDLLILTAISVAMGFLLSSPLERLGSYSRLVTAVIALVYFGLLNSSLASGGTPGKRLLRLRVVDTQGNPLAPWHSMFRSLLLVFLILVFEWQVPGISNTRQAAIILNLVFFSICAAIIYLAVVNRNTGQSLDDLLAGTRVVKTTGSPVDSYPATSRQNVIGALVIIGILPAAFWLVNQQQLKNSLTSSTSQQLLPLYQALNRDPRLEMAGLAEGYQQTPGQQLIKLLVITLWPRDYLDDTGRQKIAQEAAQLAQTDNSLVGYSGIQVQVIGGYDLGFFERSIIWFCAPPARCSAKIVRNSLLRILNFTSSYQLGQ